MRIMNLKFVRFAAYIVLVVGLNASALASCGDFLAAMAAAAVRSIQQGAQSPETKPTPRPSSRLAHPVRGRRPNHPGSVPTVEYRRD